jgi:hypothetical protein
MGSKLKDFQANVNSEEILKKGFLPRAPLKIHGQMLLGRMAASKASVGRKP